MWKKYQKDRPSYICLKQFILNFSIIFTYKNKTTILNTFIKNTLKNKKENQ